MTAPSIDAVSGLVEELRAALKLATPGKWHLGRKRIVGWINDSDDQSDGMLIPIADVYGENPDADAAWITLCSPASIVSLLDALEAQARELAEARAEIERLRGLVSSSEAQRYRDSGDLVTRIAALEDAVRVKDGALGKATVFDLGKGITVESRGDGKWAVTDRGFVLNTDGEWEYEPLPSSRTAEFIARTRFDFDEAMTRARTALSNGEPHA